MNFTTRDIPKPLWKILWRQLRIVNRETREAALDMAVFGIGGIETGPRIPDFIRLVHPSNLDARLLAAE